MFPNRVTAGKLLAARLRKYYKTEAVVLAVPRGGVPVAYEVAKELVLPMDIVLAKKLGHPMNKEYAIGAVGLHDRIVIPHEGVSNFYIEEETQNIRDRLEKMRQKFVGDKEPENLQGRTLIVIDDGIATGTTLLATIKILRKSQPDKIVVAVPVVSRSAYEKLSAEADELIALMMPKTFYGVGRFYENFEQVSDEEVTFYLNKLKAETKK